MLGWTLTFLFLAIVAAYPGFLGLGESRQTLVKFVSFVFAILVAISNLIGVLRSEPPV